MEDKTVLKETNFGRCLIAELITFHTHYNGTHANENDIIKFIGNAINGITNAKD